MNKEIEQKIKNLIFKEIKKLKTYAINYHNYKKKIQFNDIDIQNINNSIEDMEWQHFLGLFFGRHLVLIINWS